MPLEYFPHTSRDCSITREIRSDEDRSGTQSGRSQRWHGGAHSERPRLVRSRAYNRAIASPGNDDWLAPQLRVIPLLDGGVKSVHVAMNDFSHNSLATILFSFGKPVSVSRNGRSQFAVNFKQ